MGYDLAADFKRFKVMYRRLILLGFTPEESAKLIAHLMGIDVHDTKRKWTIKELQHLDFLKHSEDNSSRS